MQEIVHKLVERLALTPHPEGGYYREVFRSQIALEHIGHDRAGGARRCAGTLIYFLLAERDFSAFHRVRGADEIWHLYAGGPLELHTIDGSRRHELRVLATDLTRGEPAAVVPADCLQAARLAPGASFAFCGCTVAPGFEFADFEMPPADELAAAFPAHERIIRELTRR
ncbi:MAG TPA: cupin domain-containing protein [Gammaproteobacteria bacterium]|nr:cupin domain-containing protein [Gammaproteobacteria bacterium]